MPGEQRVRWGPPPGHVRLQALLAKEERWWVWPVLIPVLAVVAIVVVHARGCVELPPVDANQLQWGTVPGL